MRKSLNFLQNWSLTSLKKIKMHVTFVPYGIKNAVDTLLRDMEAQKFQLPVVSPDGKKADYLWTAGQLRILPGGIIDYVFPKEQLDIVLTSLDAQKKEHSEYKALYKIAPIIRKFLKLKKVEKFDTGHNLVWRNKDTAIFVIGYKEDGELIIEQEGEWKGWKHEAL